MRTGTVTDENYSCPSCKRQKLYEMRNCRKYFGDRPWQAAPQLKWEATYRTDKGTPYFVSCAVPWHECPTSYVTPQSIELVQIRNRADIAREATGAALYGPDLSKYPARLVDVFTTLANEENKERAARYEAERTETA